MHADEEDLVEVISKGLCSECAAPLLQTRPMPASWSFAIAMVSEISKTFREKSISIIDGVCRESPDPPDSADSVGAGFGHAFVADHVGWWPCMCVPSCRGWQHRGYDERSAGVSGTEHFEVLQGRFSIRCFVLQLLRRGLNELFKLPRLCRCCLERA